MPKVEMDMPEPPEGFEYTGEYRVPRLGESFLPGLSGVVCNDRLTTMRSPFPILRKKVEPAGGQVWQQKSHGLEVVLVKAAEGLYELLYKDGSLSRNYRVSDIHEFYEFVRPSWQEKE